jgi:hypothetical protein
VHEKSASGGCLFNVEELIKAELKRKAEVGDASVRLCA